MTKTCMALIAGSLVFGSSPAMAQMGSGTFTTTKPSGALGAFGWVSTLSTDGTAIGPGFAGNLWLTPVFSIGAWGSIIGYPTGGTWTDANLELKVKFFQSGTGAYDFALAGTGGVKSLSAGTLGTALGPKLGLILDWNLPANLVFQGRTSVSPFLALQPGTVMAVDYKAGLAWSPAENWGLDIGYRGQNLTLGQPNRTGPYLGAGWVF